jgi:argininosuccinate lyase
VASVAEPDPSSGGAEGRTLWHGRFADGPAEALLAFTTSLAFDRRLAADDLAGSRAHVRMLGAVGVLGGDEVASVLDALDRVERELADGDFAFAPTDEDIHTAIERRVTELAGAAGAKLHTGRSRNDQVVTALRHFVRREGAAVRDAVLDLQTVLVARAGEAGTEAYLPGYTHLQRAQPVLLGHHLLAHFWALTRDVARLDDALDRADVSPLGAGALAGSSLPLDPDATAADLGFARRFENSLDAVGDRDFVAELCFACTLVMVHLSRLGEEVVLWTSEEFGFLRLADEYATGSSMLPQKKNPDIAELARGKAGRVIGNLTGLLAMLKGLPLAYNRDLQEDKEPLFDTLDTTRLALLAVTGMMATAEFRVEVMRAAADAPASSATDLAEWLVSRGTPFREAHAIVGSLVRQSLERSVPLAELVMTDPHLGPDALGALEPGQAVVRRRTPGGAGPEPFGPQLAAARAWLAANSGDRPAGPAGT